ncbi:hypothetical protein MKX01_038472 [Papaver californicum]|nr:hypothetical protein MKX01_038472 [Papaver californicum]
MEEAGRSKSFGEDNCRHEVEPRDRYNIAYTVHFILGLGNLLPWNALITAIDYFGYLYPTKHIDKVFSIVYMGSSLPVLLVMISFRSNWFSNKERRRLSFRFRMNIGLFMFLLTLMTPPIIDWYGVSTSSSYYVIVGAVAVCGLADGLIGGSLIGFAGELPERYMQAVFAGTASSGVLVSILRIITKASLPQTAKACLHGPRWLRSEIPVIILTSLFGLSNGFFTSVLMILAPKSVSIVEAEMAGIVMALFLGFGLVLGSVVGWIWAI